VRVDVINLLVGEQSADHAIGLAGLGKSCVAHHPIRIEGPERQNSTLKRRRDLFRIYARCLHGFADENRVTGTIGIVAVV